MRVQSPWQRSWLPIMVGANQRAISLIFGMSVQVSHGVRVVWRTAFTERGRCLGNAETGPTNHEPARPPAKAEEGAVVFLPVQHAQ